MKTYNLKDKIEYLDEVTSLEYEEWADNKEEYRNNGYSRILNDAILKEAKNRGFSTLYLKTDLENYYEKFGAIFIKKLKSGEYLYKFELRK